MSVFVIWVIIIILIGISTTVRKKKDQESQARRRQQQMPVQAARKQEARPNPILEKAKQNTRDVHQSHVDREQKSAARGYGGGPAAKTTASARSSQSAGSAALARSSRAAGSAASARSSQAPRSASSPSRGSQAAKANGFGTSQIGTAASGIPAGEDERFAEQRERLLTALQKERMDANSRSGKNRIMEAAKENAIVSSLDNLMDSRRDFIKEVQELMVTGPDTDLPNQRDFVAEGTDMINQALMTLY